MDLAGPGSVCYENCITSDHQIKPSVETYSFFKEWMNNVLLLITSLYARGSQLSRVKV
jgi:hypothetical protein